MTIDSKKLKVIIFDFDGTIVDTMGVYADLAADLIVKHYGWDRNTARQEYLRTSGLPFSGQLDILIPRSSQNTAVSDEFEQKKLKVAENIGLTAETREALKQLQTKYKIVVSSSNFETNIQDFFARETVHPDLILGFRQNFNKGIEHFNFVIGEYGCQKDEMLFIGDSLHDFNKAIEFGINFVAKLGTFSLIDFQRIENNVIGVQTVGELPLLLSV